ncbi:MAG: hypothetical protein M3O94_05035 [Actinomycetota bacterium]|nr:hypothetical protein [Actinomycetota bacterium]
MSTVEVTPPRDQPVLSLLAVAATVLVFPVLVLAGDFRIVMVPGMLLAAGLVAAGRDSMHGLAALAIVAVLWVASGPDALTPWSPVLAVLMLTIHATLALRSALPPGAALGSMLLLRWFWRCVAVVGLTGFVYVVGLALHHLPRGDNEVVVVVALALLGGLVLLLRHEIVVGGQA